MSCSHRIQYRIRVQSLVLPEGGNNAQQALVQAYGVLGIVNYNPVVTGKSQEAASSWRGSLQREAETWSVSAQLPVTVLRTESAHASKR